MKALLQNALVVILIVVTACSDDFGSRNYYSTTSSTTKYATTTTTRPPQSSLSSTGYVPKFAYTTWPTLITKTVEFIKIIINNETLYVNRSITPPPVITPQNRIVGGKSVDIYLLPYQVSLRFRGEHICGGSIISQQWVLTAAHCYDNETFAYEFSFRVGSSTLNFDGTGYIHQVDIIVQHPYYNIYTTEYDACLMKAKTDFVFSPYVKAIMLPEYYEIVPEYLECIISGWGYTSENGNISQTLQVVMLPIIPIYICTAIYGSGVINVNSMLCCGVSEGGKDACQGDSGGPMQCLGKLFGVVSWGEGCARPGFPGVYTRVAWLRGWIDSTTGVTATTTKKKSG